MEQKEFNTGMLDLMIQPAFTVKDGVVRQLNDGARKYCLESGMEIKELLLTGQAEYEQLKEGCLYLSLKIADQLCDAAVYPMDGYQLITLEQEADQAELQAMALAAQELRFPLSSVMTVADQLFPVPNENNDPAMKEQIAKINRGLYQMLRIVGNMSDAYRYSQQSAAQLSVFNVTSLFEEIFQKSAERLQHGGTDLTFENLDQPVYTLADAEKLERAVYNMISNGAKFAGKGGMLNARLTRKGNMLYLTVQDNGTGMAGEMRSAVHSRFRRVPGIEDSRFGVGLGMVMIRAAASAHGGTVLIDQPENGGTKITMSITINQNTTTVRTNALSIDYAGQRDHLLVELSDVLPSDLYEV